MIEVQLTNSSRVALIDDIDQFILKYEWYLVKKGNHDYAKQTISETTYMHHLILPPRTGFLVDHKNRIGLDNQRTNLRYATPSQQGANIGGEKGVSLYRNGKWRAYIQVHSKHISLGYYYSKTDALKAYNEAAIKYFGEFAVLNRIPNEVSL